MQGYDTGFQAAVKHERWILTSSEPYASVNRVMEGCRWLGFKLAIGVAVLSLAFIAVYFIHVAFQLLKSEIVVWYAIVQRARRLKRSSASWLEPLLEVSPHDTAARNIKAELHKHSAQICDSLWANPRFTDCVVNAAGRQWKLHRNMLSAASPVFERMFASGMAEGSSQEVHIMDATAADVGAFLCFIYTGNVGEQARDAASWASLLLLADMYEIYQLADIAADNLQAMVSCENVVDILRFLKKWKEHAEIGKSYESIRSMAEARPELRNAVMQFAFESLA